MRLHSIASGKWGIGGRLELSVAAAEQYGDLIAVVVGEHYVLLAVTIDISQRHFARAGGEIQTDVGLRLPDLRRAAKEHIQLLICDQQQVRAAVTIDSARHQRAA